MSHIIHFEGPPDSLAHSSKPLDETVWHTWLNKNLIQERQRSAARIKAVKWACIGLLMATAAVSSYVFSPYGSAYQAVVRFAIALGAIVMMFESLRTRQYAFTALFAAVVLLFNPIVSIFTLAGNWLILLASVLPFVASLVWMKSGLEGQRFPHRRSVNQGRVERASLAQSRTERGEDKESRRVLV